MIAGVVVVFEVVSSSSSRIDRFVKVREYAAVPSVCRYVNLESTSIDLTVMDRKLPDDPWLPIKLLTKGDILNIPEVGIDIPVAELYEGLSYPESEDTAS